MGVFKAARMILVLPTTILVGCSTIDKPPQYGAGSLATEDERYCASVAQYEAEQVRRQNITKEGVGAAAGAAVGGVVGHNLDTDRTIEGAALGAIGGASAAYLANKDQMRSAYDTAYRRCMENRPKQ